MSHLGAVLYLYLVYLHFETIISHPRVLIKSQLTIYSYKNLNFVKNVVLLIFDN